MNAIKHIPTFIIGAALFLLASCTAHDDMPAPTLAMITQVEVITPAGATRATGDDGSAITEFAAGDEIQIFYYQGAVMKEATLTASMPESTLVWTFSKDIYVNITGSNGIKATYSPGTDVVQEAANGFSQYYDQLSATANATNGKLVANGDGTASITLNFAHIHALVSIASLKDPAGNAIDDDDIESIVLQFVDKYSYRYKVDLTGKRAAIVPDDAKLTSISIKPNYQAAITKDISDMVLVTTAANEYPLNIKLRQNTADVTMNDINPWGEEATTLISDYDYFVYTEEDLVKLADAPMTSKVLQMADIDMEGITDFVPIGKGEAGPFAGVYNGNGFTISNLTVEKTGVDNIGLFGYVAGEADNEAILTNIHLRGCNISGQMYTGALVGYAGYTVISNCSATGKVEDYNNVGGLVGYLHTGSHLTRSRSACMVTGSQNAIGGLVGLNERSTIVACTASGEVKGNNYVGGLVGYNLGTIALCYATGNAEATKATSGQAGGFVGFNANPITNCYATGNAWDAKAGSFAGYSIPNFTNCYASGTPAGTTVGDGNSMGIVTSGTAAGQVKDKAYSQAAKTIRATGTTIEIEEYFFTNINVWNTGDFPTINYTLNP